MLDFGYYNMDCMQGMKEFPDGYFDLAIVDPPYGDGGVRGATENASGNASTDTGTIPRGGGTANRHITSGLRKGQSPPKWWNMGGEVRKKIIAWDVAPKQEYFEELFRVSRHQIIWGGNYFPLPPTRCFLVWRKLNIPLSGFSMAPVEYAWTSFQKNAAMFEAFSSANPSEPRFHPTQKPVSLYAWIYDAFAERGMKILDTHLGSGSSRLAAYDAGLDFVGCEIDKFYFDKEEERFANYIAQANLFTAGEEPAEQIGLWEGET